MVSEFQRNNLHVLIHNAYLLEQGFGKEGQECVLRCASTIANEVLAARCTLINMNETNPSLVCIIFIPTREPHILTYSQAPICSKASTSLFIHQRARLN